MALWWSVPASLSDLAHCCVQALRTICFVFIMDQSKYIYKFYCLHEVQQMICVFNRNHDALQKYRSEKQYSDDWALLVGAILDRTIMQGLLVPIVNWSTLFPTVFVTFVLLDVCKIWHQNKDICWPINYLIFSNRFHGNYLAWPLLLKNDVYKQWYIKYHLY